MSADADKVTEVVDGGIGLTLSSFKTGATVMRETVERALNLPGVGLGLMLAGASERRVILAELERSVLEEFEKHLQGHRSRLIAETDQKAASK